jgi:hypothetical protein
MTTTRTRRRFGTLLGIAVFVAVLGTATPALALQPFVFLAQWGSTGSANGQFQDPSDVAVDATGAVYVSDAQLGRVQKFDANGVFIKAWTKGCKTCIAFSGPQSIAANAGVIWLADSGNQRLVKMNSNGAQLLVVPTPASGQPGHFGSGLDIAVDSAGKVYVTELLDTIVHVFNANGTFLADRNTGASLSAGAVAVDAAFNVYVTVTDSGTLRVVTINQAGTITGNFTPAGAGVGAPGISVDAQQRLYVSSGNPSIQVFSTGGVLLGQFGTAGTGPLQFNNPEATAPNSVGVLYVADRNNDRVQKVTETSTLTIRLAGIAPDLTDSATFSVSGPTPISAFALDNNPGTSTPDQRVTTNRVPGTYTISAPENVNGHILQSITCTNGASGGLLTSFPVTVQAGQSVTCTYYYEWIG